MYTLKEILRLNLVYAAIAPMFFTVLNAIVFYGFYRQPERGYDVAALFFYVWAVTILIGLIFFTLTVIQTFKQAEDRPFRDFFVGVLFFFGFTFAYFALVIYVSDFVYGLNLLNYVKEPRM